METDAARRERLLRFVIVGAGPTGVELAGTIAELARFTLAADFRRIDPRSAKIVLVEAGPARARGVQGAAVAPTRCARSRSSASKCA